MTDTTQPSTDDATDEPDTDDAAGAAGTNDDGTGDTGTGVAGASAARKTETDVDESSGTELTTDRTLEDTTDAAVDADPGESGAADRAPGDREDDEIASVVRYTYWGAFGLLSLLAVIALFQFYTSASTAIDLWVESEYEPIMQAAFNLVVLLAAVIGVSRVVRELS